VEKGDFKYPLFPQPPSNRCQYVKIYPLRNAKTQDNQKLSIERFSDDYEAKAEVKVPKNARLKIRVNAGILNLRNITGNSSSFDVRRGQLNLKKSGSICYIASTNSGTLEIKSEREMSGIGLTFKNCSDADADKTIKLTVDAGQLSID
jgi:hypothetical protein